jgi:coenzyme F420-reducing hydrogenase beta subunit
MESEDQIDRVVEGGYCIGCGGCAAARPELYQIRFNQFGEYQSFKLPYPYNELPQSPIQTASVCPFSGASANEDEIGKRLFSAHASYHPQIGYYLASFVGSVTIGEFRASGSSGGMTNWFLCQMLQRNLVDAVIHVRPSGGGSHPLFAYAISRQIDEVMQGAKSRYYPIEFSKVMQQVRETDGRYAFVGVPCFVKAVRLLMEQDSLLQSRIKYCIALFCGHLKSTAFTDAVAWETGVSPLDVKNIDFRHKLADRPANRYGVKIECKDGSSLTRPMEGLSTADWGAGLLKYRACDYCDDVVGETADISFGDAWLPRFVTDSQGTNVAIVRNLELLQVIKSGIESEQLDLQPTTPDDVAASQKSGFRHRRYGLKYRLWKKQKAGEWFPQKRVQPTRSGMSRHDRRLFDARLALVELGRIAFREAVEKQDFKVFLERIRPLLDKYRSFYRRLFWARVTARVRRVAERVKARFFVSKRRNIT